MSSSRALAFVGMCAVLWFFPPRGAGQAPPAPLPPGVYRIGGGVSAPVLNFRPEPEYSEEARAAKLEGAVLLSLIVDENGVPQNMRVVRPLGSGLDEKAIEAVRKWRFKPGLKDGKPVAIIANVEVNFRLGPPPEFGIQAAPGATPIAAGGAIPEPRIVQRVPPVYPPEARAARVEGVVELSATIGPEGKVQDVQFVSGPPMLVQAAIDAVSKWVYQPVLLNNKPISVRTKVTVNFVLQ